MKAIQLVFLCFLFLSCNENKNNKSERFLPASNGNLNTVSIVLENSLWEGKVGEQIRDIFAAPLDGLPTDEPLFKLRQIPPQVFSGFATRSRITLEIDKKPGETEFRIVKDAYAEPQTVAYIRASSNKAIIQTLSDNKSKIIDAFNKEEVNEKQRRIKLSLLDDKTMENELGFKINIPSVYRIGVSAEEFFWVRKNLTNAKTMDLMFYEVPINAIAEGDSTVTDIIRIRNHMTKTKIPGEDDIYMKVEDAYTPFIAKTTIDNKPAYEVRGMWKVEGQYMGGPFMTYAIEDKKNERYLIAGGYVYAPSLNKRDFMFEIESIIKSIAIE